jgi:hypothetical protein
MTSAMPSRTPETPADLPLLPTLIPQQELYVL